MAERRVAPAFAPAVTAAAAGATTDAVLRTTTAGASRAVPGGFRRGQKILLVGEGNFSFALALALGLGSGDSIVATGKDVLGRVRVWLRARQGGGQGRGQGGRGASCAGKGVWPGCETMLLLTPPPGWSVERLPVRSSAPIRAAAAVCGVAPAAAFDTFREARDKYPTAVETNVAVLQRLGCRPLFGVDASRLASDPAVASALLEAQTGEASSSARLPAFDRIVFNFPHTGGATTADIKRNQALLRDFLAQAALLLKTRSPGTPVKAGDEAQVLVALRRTSFYESWRCDVQGQACRLDFRGTKPFVAAQFPGYAPVRTHPATREAPGAGGDGSGLGGAAGAGSADWYTFSHSRASATHARQAAKFGPAVAAEKRAAAASAKAAQPDDAASPAAAAEPSKRALKLARRRRRAEAETAAAAAQSKGAGRAAKRGRAAPPSGAAVDKRAKSLDPEAEAALAAAMLMGRRI